MAELSREQFARHVLEVVRQRFPLVKIGRAKEPFSMRLNGHVASLENLYRLAMLMPDEIDHHVQRWAVELLRAAEGTPDRHAPFDALADRVLPIVLGGDEKSLAGEGVFAQQLVPGLSVAYVLDGDRTIAHIPERQLAEWKVSLEDLHEKAIANLVARSQQLAADAAQDENGRMNLVLFQTRDGYDSSRILLPNLHERLREHLGSPFVAAVPNRDILICFRDDAGTVDSLRTQISHDYRTMPHQVSEKLFLVTPDGLAPHSRSG